MVLTKKHIKIIQYVEKHPYCSFSKIKKHFKKMLSFEESFHSLRRNQYILPSSGNYNQYGEWLPNDISTYTVTDLGTSVCEANKLFTLEFMIKNVILPIVIAVITTLITISLSALL